MRKIFFSLLVLLLCFSANAQEYDYCAGAGGAAASCSTQQNNATGVDTKLALVGNDANIMVAARFTVGATGFPVCKIRSSIKRIGTPATNLTVEVWRATTSHPIEKVGITADGGGCAGNGTCTAATTSESFTDYFFTLSTPTDLTAGSKYYVVYLAGTNDTNNMYVINGSGTDGGDYLEYYRTEWLNADATYTSNLTLYSE
jgi:hypothetical protein